MGHWTHICINFDLEEKLVRTSINSREIIKYNRSQSIVSAPLTDLQIRLGGSYQGLISNIHIFFSNMISRSFTPKICKEQIVGDISWNDLEGRIKNSNQTLFIHNTDLKHICEGNKLFPVIIPFHWHFEEAKRTCKLFGNGIINDFQYFDAPKNNYMRSKDINFWTPYSDEEEEGTYRNVYNQEVMPNYQWQDQQPNGGIEENFIIFNTKQRAIKDVEIKRPEIGLSCMVPQKIVTLRGFCPDSFLENYFYVRMQNGALTYFGLSAVEISYNKSAWVATNRKVPGFIAYTTFGGSMALGELEWVVKFDSRKCTDGKHYKKKLTFSFCSEEEFTCKDGNCIDMAHRCDGKTHCDDSSDEQGCITVHTNVGYNKLLVAEDKEKLHVEVSFESHEVLVIDEPAKTIKIMFTFKKSWYDSYLRFFNLKNGSENWIRKEESEKMWMPWVYILNQEDRDKCRTTDKKEIMKVIPNPDFEYIKSPLNSRKNAYIFGGSKNKIYNENDWTCDFICSFDYRWYPFDTQNCPLILMENYKVEIVAGEVKHFGSYDIGKYEFQSINKCTTDKNGRKGLIIDFVFKRPFLSNLMTLFLPTGMLLLISQMSTAFSLAYREMVIEVNTTLLLVLTTFFIGISDELPVTGYIKMVDVWMIFTMFYPFLEITLHSFKEICTIRLEREETSVNFKLMTYMANFFDISIKWILPGFGLLFIFMFSSTAIYVYYYPNLQELLMCL